MLVGLQVLNAGNSSSVSKEPCCCISALLFGHSCCLAPDAKATQRQLGFSDMVVNSARYLTESSSNLCVRFRQDGYLILPGAIDPDLIDRTRGEIEDRLAFVPLDQRSTLPGFSFDTGRFQDAWRVCPSVAEIAGFPEVLNALSELYGLDAHPFQTLNFTVGTEQRAHSDHIHFSSRPLGFMCGVWVAIEDVTDENGPLFYYPGSHNLPYMSYAELGIDLGSLNSEPEGYIHYETEIQKLAEAHGFKRQTFKAKKGDVLIWAANLIHGGSPVTKNGTTRWSQVTHYLFDDCVHYTPRLSDEVVGNLYVRYPVDIRNAVPIRSAYPVPAPLDSAKTAITNSEVNELKETLTAREETVRDQQIRIDRLMNRNGQMQAEIDAMRNTRLFRYSRAPRAVYAKLRRQLKAK